MSVPCRRLALLALLIVPMSCGLSHPYPSKAFYVLPSSDLAPLAETSPITLTIPRASVSPPFDSRALQYRVGETLYEPAYYQQWATDPGSLVSAAVSRSLASTGGFVALSEGAAPGAPILMLTVTELYADVRDPQAPRAVLAMQASLLDAHGAVLTVHEARSSEPALSDHASDIINAWARGLAEISATLVPRLSPPR